MVSALATPASTAPAGAPARGTAPRRVRNVALWVGAVVLLTALLAILAPRGEGERYLDPAGTGQSGIRALLAVLESQGVDVATVETIADLRAAVATASEETTVAVGPTDVLSPDGADAVVDAARDAAHLVLLDGGRPIVARVEPGLRVLAVGARGVSVGGDCTDPVTRDRALISTWAVRIVTEGEVEDASSCYPLPSGDGEATAHLLVSLADTSARPAIDVVGFGPALTNRYIVHDGHAALGVRLLGRTPRLVVLTPSLTDPAATAGEPDPEAVELPAWLVPGVLLVALAVVAYAVASGRRLGRLVAEPLPVVVRASETTFSRAELYREARDVERAAAMLRAGTLARLRKRLGLHRSAGVDAVIGAVAAHGIPAGEVGPLLTGPPPRDDAGLARLAHDLTTLEEKVTHR